MEVVIQFGLLAIGFLLLIKGADWFVGSSSKIADRFGIPQLIIGLTIVAMGTSAPEAAVSISAALKNTAQNNSAEIAIGNILGSNILNVLLILGITSVIVTIPVQISTIRYELPFMIVITCLLAGIGYFKGYLGRVDGILLWVLMAVYLVYLVLMAKKGQISIGVEEAEVKVNENMFMLLFLLVIGISAIVLGSDIAVDAATALARIFEMNERLIGLTIVAFGTSLPELITSITAAMKKKADIAVGNIVGSNIFNILFVIGTTSLITDVPYNYSFNFDSIVCIGASLLLFLCVMGKKKLSRMQGVFLLCVFFASRMEEGMKKKYDVVALGELLIDFTDNGVSKQGNTMFEANPGGAPCNVLAMLQKLGDKTAFIGKVGEDIFGEKLKNVLEEVGINTSGLIMDKEVRTTLAFVQTLKDGDRDFSFYRNPGADMMLEEGDINNKLIKNCKIFHFGTLSMTHKGVRKATKKAIKKAKENGALISFDPNLRPPLWKSLEDAKEQVEYGLNQCDILKISDNEIQWFTGEKDFDKGIKKLQDKYPIKLIVLSMGKDGSRAYYKDLKVEKSAFVQKKTIETTGAGDTFGGCCLHFILKYGLDNLDKEKLEKMLTFANAAASIITTKKGALRVMPTKDEVKDFIKSY